MAALLCLGTLPVTISGPLHVLPRHIFGFWLCTGRWDVQRGGILSGANACCVCHSDIVHMNSFRRVTATCIHNSSAYLCAEPCKQTSGRARPPVTGPEGGRLAGMPHHAQTQCALPLLWAIPKGQYRQAANVVTWRLLSANLLSDDFEHPCTVLL